MNKNNNEKKEKTCFQYCSSWVTDFTNRLLEPQNVKFNIGKDINYYICLSNQFKQESIENIIIHMLKTNNKLKNHLKSNNVDPNEAVDKIFRNTNCINEFIEDLKNFVSDVVEPTLLHSKNNKKNAIKNKLNNYDRINKVYNTGILDFEFVKSKLSPKTDFWKVKEAVSWLVGFVENCDYQLKDLFILNDAGFVDKDKTFRKLLDKVNESAITQKNPFTTKYKDLYFNDAKGGEVDVMLWDQKELRIIAMSATRDRGYKIEGNQFPRHFIKSLILYDKIRKVCSDKKNPIIPTSKNVQNIVRDKELINKIDLEKSLIQAKDPNVVSEIENMNAFAKELTLMRSKIGDMTKVNFHKNGVVLDDLEISSLLAYGSNKVKFVFYGELLENKSQPLVQAGLNCIAYRDNFKRLGKFRLTEQASNIFMRHIDKRFNNINVSEKNLDSYGQDFLYYLIKNNDNDEKIIPKLDYFSESNVYNEERGCLFKAATVMFKNVNTEINKSIFLIDKGFSKYSNKSTINNSIKKGLTFFFDQGIDDSQIHTLLKFFDDKKQLNQFVENFNNIKTSTSEVPLELEELENTIEKFTILKENLEMKIEIDELKKTRKSKNKNNIKI